MGEKMLKTKKFSYLLILLISLSLVVTGISILPVNATDSLFGYDGTGGSSEYNNGYIVGSIFTCEDNGTVINVKALMYGGGNAKVAIYYSNLTLVAQSTETAITIESWYTFTFSGTINLYKDYDYILVAWHSGTWYLKYNTGYTNQGYYQAATYGSNFPNPLVPTNNNNKYSIYCNYEIVYDYVYNFYGLYNESTGLIDPEESRAVNVTVYFTEDLPSETFLLNGTETKGYYTQPQYFVFQLGESNRQYWIEPDETDVDIYVFDDSLTDYTINFLDFCGALNNNPYVTAQFYINGTLMTMDKRKVDQQSSVSMSLVNTRKYVISLSGTGTTYVWGDLLMTDSTTIQLTIKAMDFPKEQILKYAYMRVYSFREFSTPTGSITIYYEDTRDQTTSVEINIDYTNGTNAYDSIQYTSSFSIVWSDAENDTSYQVNAIVTHEIYGVSTWKQFLLAQGETQSSPFTLDFLGTGWSLWDIDTSVFIPALLIVCAAGCFSVLNAQVGAILATITAIILTALGWIPIAPAALLVSFVLSILMVLIYAKRRVTTY